MEVNNVIVMPITRENHRRGRTEIISDVLKVIDMGLNKPTRIMYASNLSWVSLKTILDKLVTSGYVSRVAQRGRCRYFMTDIGREFLSNVLAVSEGVEKLYGNNGVLEE